MIQAQQYQGQVRVVAQVPPPFQIHVFIEAQAVAQPGDGINGYDAAEQTMVLPKGQGVPQADFQEPGVQGALQEVPGSSGHQGQGSVQVADVGQNEHRAIRQRRFPQAPVQHRLAVGQCGIEQEQFRRLRSGRLDEGTGFFEHSHGMVVVHGQADVVGILEIAGQHQDVGMGGGHGHAPMGRQGLKAAEPFSAPFRPGVNRGPLAQARPRGRQR